MFRGKESSNRIELSRLVQDLLNFGVLGSLWLWGWGDGWMGWGDGWMSGGGGGMDGLGGGGWGIPPHMCTCTRTHTHVCMVNMIISCKWPPPLEESLGIPYDVICTCVCASMCMCTYVLGHPLTTSTHPHPPGGTTGISQNSIALELIEIFQFHLKI